MPVKNFQPRHKAAKGRSFNGRKEIEGLYKNNDDWKLYRLRYLAINSRCYRCGVAATVVDHLRPHLGDEALFKQLDNHIPLCERCHNTATGLFDRNFREGSSIKSKIEWLSLGRASKGLDFKVKVLPYYGPER